MVLLSAILLASSGPAAVTWTKITIEAKFRSEAVAVADVNRDKQLDVLVGDFWYDGKTSVRSEIRPPLELGDGFSTYSEAFGVYSGDVNGDGWADQVVVGYPGKAALWYENPKGKAGHWKERMVWPSACNESPLYADLFSDGKPVMVMGAQPSGFENQGQMLWLTLGNDPDALWDAHAISEPSSPGKEIPGTQRYSHGLGVGDVNGDKRNDVIVTEGWWEQPADGRKATKPWVFHPGKLGNPCSQMVVQDIDGDKKADILSSSAHDYGIWASIQKPDGWSQETLFARLISTTHSFAGADIDGDKVGDLVTGKRYWAHGWNDPGARDPSQLLWLKGIRDRRDGSVRFEPFVIDQEVGVGTGIVIADFNRDRRPDVIVSNKRGVYVLLQKRG